MTDPIYVRKNVSFTKIRPKGTLPLWVHWKNKWITGFFLSTFGLMLYLTSNHFPWMPPHQLSLTPFDRLIPLVPWTIWIYFSLFLYIPTVYGLNRCVVSLNKHLYSFFFTILISILSFYLFPITYPRELYPIQESLSLSTPFQILRHWDHPNNCAPSLHVSLAYQIALGFLEDQKKYFPFIFTWATLLSLSTLTTKQHYCVDVVLGIVLAIVVHWIFHHFLHYWHASDTCENNLSM